jgi:hypothetical protein
MLRTSEKPKNHGEPWSPQDDATLTSLAPSTPVALIAKQLGRTSASVETRAAILKVKTFYRLPFGGEMSRRSTLKS